MHLPISIQIQLQRKRKRKLISTTAIEAFEAHELLSRFVEFINNEPTGVESTGTRSIDTRLFLIIDFGIRTNERLMSSERLS